MNKFEKFAHQYGRFLSRLSPFAFWGGAFALFVFVILRWLTLFLPQSCLRALESIGSN